MNNRGYTLLELLVAVTIVGILVVVSAFSFQGWVGRYRMESELRQMHADMMAARARAMERNRMHFFNFPSTTSYRVSEDDSNGTAKVLNGDGLFEPQAVPNVITNNTDTTLSSFPKTVDYTINGGVTLTFDNKGLMYSGTPPGTLIDPAAPQTVCFSAATDLNPDYDCIMISATRMDIGKLTTAIINGGLCNAANCIIK